jgi:hypothetical protein
MCCRLQYSAMMCAMLAGVATTSAAQGFDLDLPAAQIARIGSEHILEDLVVGDTGRITSDFICFQDRGLFVDPLAPLRAEDGVTWHVTIRPGSAVSADIRTGDEQASPQDVRAELHSVFSWLACDAYNQTFLRGETPLRPILSINGTTRLSDLLKAEDRQ